METAVRETGDMVRVLAIKADASDLKTDVKLALRKQQSVTNLRGFRVGRVPMNMVRRLYAKEIEERVVQNLIQEVFQDLVVDDTQYEPLGGPREIHRDYTLDGDLEVQVEFYVFPCIQMADLEGQVLEVPTADVTEAVVEFYIKKKMSDLLDPRSLTGNERIGVGDAGAFDQVTYEVEEIDPDTGVRLIGTDSEDEKKRHFDFGSTHLDNWRYKEYKELFVNRCVGEEIVIEEENDQDAKLVEIQKVKSKTRIKILEAERFDWPEIDDDWAYRISSDRVESAEKLNDWVREHIQDLLKSGNRSILKNALTYRMLELHPFSIPREIYKLFLPEFYVDQPSFDENSQFTKSIRWSILRNSIGEQLDHLLADASSSFESEDGRSESPIHTDEDEELVDLLLEHFEIKYLPFSERDIAQITEKLEDEII